MSYRIFIGIVKIKDLNNHIKKDFNIIKDKDKRHDAEYDFFDNYKKIELNHNLDLNIFRPIKKYKNNEYPIYRLNKKDFQKILDYYKKFILEDIKKKYELTKIDFFKNKERIIKDDDAILNNHFLYFYGYFEDLIEQNKNIKTTGLFVLDYFYLVRLFENIKTNECFIIKSG